MKQLLNLVWQILSRSPVFLLRLHDFNISILHRTRCVALAEYVAVRPHASVKFLHLCHNCTFCRDALQLNSILCVMWQDLNYETWIGNMVTISLYVYCPFFAIQYIFILTCCNDAYGKQWKVHDLKVECSLIQLRVEQHTFYIEELSVGRTCSCLCIQKTVDERYTWFWFYGVLCRSSSNVLMQWRLVMLRNNQQLCVSSDNKGGMFIIRGWLAESPRTCYPRKPTYCIHSPCAVWRYTVPASETWHSSTQVCSFAKLLSSVMFYKIHHRESSC